MPSWIDRVTAKLSISVSSPATGAVGTVTGTPPGSGALATEAIPPVPGAGRDRYEGIAVGGGRLETETVPGDPGRNSLETIDYRSGPVYGRWLERVQNYSPWNDVFSMEQQETSLVIDVPFENRYYFVPYCLGFSWVDGARLRRLNPIQHPYWSWMRAARVAHVGVKYTGSKVYTTAHGRGSQFGSARYKLARFTIAFANYPWDFYEDKEIATPADEWKRNVIWEQQPTAQMLAAEGGAATLKFAYTAPGGPPAGTSFRAQMGTAVGQIKYVLTWKWVPYDYAFFKRIPTNLYNAVMKLNATTAFGDFPAGTLLFDPPEITNYVYPVRTRDRVALMCDIKVPFTYMNPPRGITDSAFGGDPRIARQRGHNLAPYRNNNLWYPALRASGAPTFDSDGNLQNGLFPFHDWSNMFTRPTASE